MQLAEDLGIKVECRPVPEEELETLRGSGGLRYGGCYQSYPAY